MGAIPAYIARIISDPANGPITSEEMTVLSDIITAAKEARKHDALNPKIERDERRAQEELIRRNIRLVISIAKSFSHRVDLEELIGAGNLALTRCVKAWNPTIGPLTPWVIRWVRSAMVRTVDLQRTIRLPEEIAYRAAILANTANELAEVLGRPATVEELAEMLEITADEVKKLLALPEAYFSTDMPGVINQVKDLKQPEDPSEIVEKQDTREKLLEAVKELTDREAQVIIARFSLAEDGEQITLVDLGEQMNMSRENVRKLEASALAKLRHPALKVDLSGLNP